MEVFDSELFAISGYKEAENEKIIKTSLKNRTDFDCGYIQQNAKNAGKCIS